MKNNILKLSLLLIGIILTSLSSAQISDPVANSCLKHLENKFISDGQQYRALLFNSNETAEFSTTLFRETTYRVAACSGLSDGNLVFWVYDSERNLIFTNENHQYAPYWDFKVVNTIDCVIDAKLNANTNSGSGRAVVLIGFKQ